MWARGVAMGCSSRFLVGDRGQHVNHGRHETSQALDEAIGTRALDRQGGSKCSMKATLASLSLARPELGLQVVLERCGIVEVSLEGHTGFRLARRFEGRFQFDALAGLGTDLTSGMSLRASPLSKGRMVIDPKVSIPLLRTCSKTRLCTALSASSA